MENNTIYEQLRAVPKEAQKTFSNGNIKNFTDINPMWRIKRLTEIFGPCGVGWYWGEPQFKREDNGDTVTIHCKVALYIKVEGEWSQPIWGVGGNTLQYITKEGYCKVTDEAYKMAYTDACGIAAKQLGLGADIWFSQDKTKYTAQDKTQERKPDKIIVTGDIYAKIERCKTKDELKQIWDSYPQLQGVDDFKDAMSFQRNILGL